MFVLFDMDGVLVDSEPVWKETERAMLASYGINMEIEELKKHAGATTFDFCTKMARLNPALPLNVDEMVEKVVSEMAIEIRKLPLMPGVESFINQLHREGVPMAIASSSSIALIEAVIDQHQLPIDHYESGSALGVSKPHPEVFLRAAARLNAPTWQCLVIEDSINGTIAGKAGSFTVAVVPEQFPPRVELSIADYAFESMHRLNEAYNKGVFESLN